MYYVYDDDKIVYADANVVKANLYAASITDARVEYDEGAC